MLTTVLLAGTQTLASCFETDNFSENDYSSSTVVNQMKKEYWGEPASN